MKQFLSTMGRFQLIVPILQRSFCLTFSALCYLCNYFRLMGIIHQVICKERKIKDNGTHFHWYYWQLVTILLLQKFRLLFLVLLLLSLPQVVHWANYSTAEAYLYVCGCFLPISSMFSSETGSKQIHKISDLLFQQPMTQK